MKLVRLWFGITLLLLTIGALAVYSSSFVFALEIHNNAKFFIKKHLFGLSLGLIGAFFLYRVPAHVIRNYAYYLFSICYGLTLATLIPSIGIKIHGASRWINLGITFQPSELLKIAYLIFIAAIVEEKIKNGRLGKKSLLPLAITIILPIPLLLMQPDFGLMCTLLLTSIIVIFIAGFPLRYIGYSIAGLIPALCALIVMKPYRIKRILTFLNPWSDPLGAGFQIIQSLIAIGSGKWTGVGISQSKQKFFYLPMQHTDFIFSILAEETGFLGILVTFFLFLLFIYVGFRLALMTQTLFSFLIISGFISMMSIEILINICVATGLVPTKGIGLPFISYGNSSLIVHIWLVGLCAGLVRSESNSTLSQYKYFQTLKI